MFTGFASENTPAIQVWDFFSLFANTSAVRSVSLADDCAPIQVFRTGATGQSAIRVYLPTAPIEGKQITIVNQQYGQNIQNIEIYSSDARGTGTSSYIFSGGPSSSIVLVYSKQNISFGIVNGLLASGWISLSQSSVSSASYASAIVGGDSNKINSTYGFIGSGVNNRISGTAAAIIGGQVNAATNTNAVVVGGTNNSSDGGNSAVVGGSTNTASVGNAAVIGGTNNLSDSINTVVIGGAQGTTRNITGNFVTPASNAPISSSLGVQQLATLLLGRQTTNATATVLTSNTFAASTTNQVILPNNSAYAFQGTVIANVTGAGDTSAWKFEGVIKRGANAASTTLVAAVTPTVIAQDVGAVTWAVAVTADTTNGGIKVEVTGAAATTIRWVCKIETTEVTF
jgi:hypothetical protein